MECKECGDSGLRASGIPLACMRAMVRQDRVSARKDLAFPLPLKIGALEVVFVANQVFPNRHYQISATLRLSGIAHGLFDAATSPPCLGEYP